MSAFSFKKEERIVKKADFKRLWKSGKKIHGEFFIIHYSRNSLGKARLGVTVSKRVGCAVVRNRIKRLIRDYFRRNKTVFNDMVDMNVIAKAGVKELSNQDIYQTLERNFLKISKDSRDEARFSSAH